MTDSAANARESYTAFVVTDRRMRTLGTFDTLAEAEAFAAEESDGRLVIEEVEVEL